MTTYEQNAQRYAIVFTSIYDDFTETVGVYSSPEEANAELARLDLDVLGEEWEPSVVLIRSIEDFAEEEEVPFADDTKMTEQTETLSKPVVLDLGPEAVQRAVAEQQKMEEQFTAFSQALAARFEGFDSEEEMFSSVFSNDPNSAGTAADVFALIAKLSEGTTDDTDPDGERPADDADDTDEDADTR